MQILKPCLCPASGSFMAEPLEKPCMHACSDMLQSCPTLCKQAPPSMGFSRQEYWSGLPFSLPRDLPNPGIEPISPATPALQADSSTSETPGKPGETLESVKSLRSPDFFSGRRPPYKSHLGYVS